MPLRLNLNDNRMLDEIEDLLVSGDDDGEALALAVELVERRPRLTKAWAMLVEAAQREDEWCFVFYATHQLSQLTPYDEINWNNLIVACGKLDFRFTAQRAVETFLERFPQSEHSGRLRQVQILIDQDTQEQVAAGIFPENPDSLGWSWLETARMFLTMERYAEARRDANEAARRIPDNPAPLNHISLSYILEGDYPRAESSANECLAAFPGNIFALSVKAQSLIRLGRSEEVRPLLDEAARQETTRLDYLDKLMESCASAHEHQLLLDIYQRGVEFAKSHGLPLIPTMYALAGTAYAFLGNEKAARREWKKIPKSNPVNWIPNEIISESFAYGPWYFPMEFWLPLAWGKVLLPPLESRHGDGNIREMTRWIEKTPGVVPTLSVLLERGGPDALEIVFALARFYPVPGLAEFAQGRRGTEILRARAAALAMQHGMITADEAVNLVGDSEYGKIRLKTITAETGPETLPPRVLRHIENSYSAMSKGDGARALREIDAGMKIAPGNPTLSNHQIVALNLLGRHEEADEIARALAEREPDYFFARTAMADLCIREGRLDEAEVWFAPLDQRDKYHFSEFITLAVLKFQFYLIKMDADRAEMWLEILDEVEPDAVPETARLQVKFMRTMGKMFKKPGKWK